MFNPINLKNFIGGNSIEEKDTKKKSNPNDKISKSINKIIELNKSGIREDFKIPEKKIETTTETKNIPEKLETTSETKNIPEKLETSTPSSKIIVTMTQKKPDIENLIQLVNPNIVNAAFNRADMHKIINGQKYRTYEEFRESSILNCFIETCELTWNNTPWRD